MTILFNEKENRLIIFSFFVIFLYLSPLYILGENAHIRVHDNLDSNIAWYKVLAESGQISSSIDATIPQIINGSLSRNAFASEFSLIVWLYKFFPTMAAYAISQTITRIVAFLGMYLLLKKHFLAKDEWMFIRVGVALSFSLTLFWPSGMLSTLGMPLALWAYLNIRKGEGTWREYAVLTLLPFYSSIVLGFLFFLVGMGLLWITDLVIKKRLNLRFLFSIIYMTLVYTLVEYRLVSSFFLQSEPNSRDEYFHARLSFGRSLWLTVKNYVLGHHHVMTAHAFFILPVIFAAFLFIISKRPPKKDRVFVGLFWLNLVLSAWYAFWFYKGWLPLTKQFHFLDTFNFARFHFLRPLIIYVLFAIGLRIWWERGGKWKSRAKGFLLAQIILLFFINEEIVFQYEPSVKEFLAVKQFQEIKEHIGLPVENYRVVSIGIHPAIAQYNGFYTLDTYNNFYPLSYKYEFRKIIEKELEKNKSIRTYYDEWGGRCYVFTDELGKHYMFGKRNKRSLKNLELNVGQFKKMGGEYILSAVKIENAEENKIKLDRVFNSSSSAWKIYLYKPL